MTKKTEPKLYKFWDDKRCPKPNWENLFFFFFFEEVTTFVGAMAAGVVIVVVGFVSKIKRHTGNTLQIEKKAEETQKLAHLATDGQ